MFVLVYFALKKAQRYHADPRTLSTRSWCLYAKYIFRKYNELPHWSVHKQNFVSLSFLTGLQFSAEAEQGGPLG